MRKLCLFLLAISLLMACVPAAADSYEDMMNRAGEYIAAGDHEKAVACYQLAHRLQPEEEAPLFLEADAHIALSKYQS